MTKLYSRLLPLLVLAVISGYAQTVTQTTVLTNPAGPEFSVDGTVYSTAMSAFWPVGSAHTLSVPQGAGYSYDYTSSVQWVFQGWQGPSGNSTSPTIQVVANVGASKYVAQFNVAYRFNIQVACNPGPCSSVPGAIEVNGAVPDPSTMPLWVAPGSSETVYPLASYGYIFSGWQIGNNIVSTSQLYNVPMNGPTTVTAVFVPAKAVNLVSNPPNLTFYADGVLVTTPITMQWGLGTTHSISGLNLTNDGTEKRWVFSSWSDGGAQTHNYVVGKNTVPETLTCNYAAAAYPFFKSSPPNLALVVDGKVLPPPYSYIWAIGSTHTISATTPQTDSQGTTWVFQSWDDGGTTPSRTIIIPAGADVNGYGLTAVFTQKATLNVNSTIAGQSVTVNGTTCTTPCNLTFPAGAPIRASVPALVNVSPTSRQDFLGWSAGNGNPVRGDFVSTLNVSNTSITANYRLMNSLAAASNPPRGASWRFVPSSPDGFYEAGTTVQIRVAPRPGFRFRSWSGDLSGSEPNASLSMSVPRSVTAVLAASPMVSRGGVTNAAGAASNSGVAPGSVASIYGTNLTAETVVGPSSPLAKTLAGVTVRIGPRALPLFFASPDQINFQIPPDLALGDRTVTVSSEGMPEVTSDFSIVRNAPGIFPAVLDGQMYAMVMHEDGTPVTVSAPARQGELLTAYGTGFGPTDHARSEAIAVPASPRFQLLDPITIQVGSALYTPEASFAAPGQVGVDAVQFRLDASAPSGAAVAVYLTVNGVKSNSLTLPIQ